MEEEQEEEKEDLKLNIQLLPHDHDLVYTSQKRNDAHFP